MHIIRSKRSNLYHSNLTPTLAVTAGGSSWLIDEVWVEPKELEFLAYEEKVTKNFNEIQASQSQMDTDSMDYARSQGVENEWEMMSFFASEEVNAPPNVFQYVNDEGVIITFTEDELEAIENWNPGEPNPIGGMEGHHIKTIHENPNDIVLASDSDNIFLATQDGHRTHLHGGNTKNPTQDEYLDVKLTNEERLVETIEFNENEIVPGYFESVAATMGVTIGIGVTIGQIITLHNLKNNPMPWNEKRLILGKAALVSTAISGGVGAVAHSANYILRAGFEDLSVGTIDDFFTEMIGLGGSIFTAQLALATVNYIRFITNGRNTSEALKRFQNEITTAVAELAVFSALGLGLEIGIDALGGLLMNAIPLEPTGVLLALRLGYSVMKIGSKVHHQRKNVVAYERCFEIRQQHAYRLARG